MNYSKIYNSIIEKAKLESRERSLGTYYEGHHIVPKCLGGSGKVSEWRTHPNIVLLTAREHFICHWLLARIYPENTGLRYAFWMMCNNVGGNSRQRYIPSSIAYQEARQNLAHKEETKNKLREVRIGKKHRPESIEKMRGKKHSEETKKKRSAALKGRVKSKEHLERNAKAKMKSILHIETGIVYESRNAAALAAGVGPSAIQRRAKKGLYKYLGKTYNFKQKH